MNVIGRSRNCFSKLFSLNKRALVTLNYYRFAVRYFSLSPREFSCRTVDSELHNTLTNNVEIGNLSKKNHSLSSCDKCTHECEDQYKFFCEGCKYLKNPDILDEVKHFELFGLEEEFDIDTEKLDQMFYELQQMFHPDRFSMTNDPDLVENSTTYSSFINNSYKLLKDDLERAKYILERKGYQVLEESDQLTDMDFLMYIMEIREEIEFSETQEELNIIKADAILKKTSIVEEISDNFKLHNYEDIKDLLIQLRYNTRILEAIDNKEREFI